MFIILIDVEININILWIFNLDIYKLLVIYNFPKEIKNECDIKNKGGIKFIIFN